jgi:SAM-dependent methyltransferase
MYTEERHDERTHMSTDRAWVEWGERDPYFAVITDPKFRSDKLDDKAREEFFQSGHNHVRYLLGMCRKQAGANYAPRRVLDFGCGVGRVTIPFAEQPGVELAVGIDVSPAMLEEARRNQALRGLQNVEFVLSDPTLSLVEGQYDLVHSFIVFQHIDVARGRELFAALLDKLAPGGVGALHVLYGKAYHPERFGQPPLISHLPGLVDPMVPSGLRGWLLGWVRRQRRRTQDASDAGSTANRDPEMQMNAYNLSEIAFLLRSAGVRNFHAELTDHGGELGAFIFFAKPAAG